jgi:hypothetical protein
VRRVQRLLHLGRERERLGLCAGGLGPAPALQQLLARRERVRRSLLPPNVFGTADVSFTAGDAGGPGVYNVTAKVDGTTVYGANPDTNSGRCVSVGTDTASDAFMFDWQQRCPTTEFVDVPVNTAGLLDGRHQLTIAVTDADQNTSTVLNENDHDPTVGHGDGVDAAPEASPRQSEARDRLPLPRRPHPVAAH